MSTLTEDQKDELVQLLGREVAQGLFTRVDGAIDIYKDRLHVSAYPGAVDGGQTVAYVCFRAESGPRRANR